MQRYEIKMEHSSSSLNANILYNISEVTYKVQRIQYVILFILFQVITGIAEKPPSYSTLRHCEAAKRKITK